MFSEDDVLKLIKEAKEKALNKFEKKQYIEAEIILSQILKINPDNLEVMQLLGLTKHRLKKFEEAISIFDAAIQIDESNYENYNNKGLCLVNLGRHHEAIENIKKSIEINPNCAFLYGNLGLQYRYIKKTEEAISCFEKSIEIEPNETAWSMLGGCYGENKQLEKAEECFLKALEINPNFAPAHVDIANVYLNKKEWEKAWSEYEWRFDVFDQLKVWKNLYDPEKKWNGENLEGKTIIVHGEQGCGDSIHFFRYIPFIKSKKIILHCAEQLSSIFKHHVSEIYTQEPTLIKREDLPEHDYHCSILSLPHILKMKEIPPFDLNIKRKEDLSNYDNFYKIGIVWAGNPQHPNDSERSCHLTLFKNIHDIPGVKLFSLVKDTRPRIYRFMKDPLDLTDGTENMGIVDMSSIIKSFADTAAIINSLDLVITVDTSTLHLAGSLNKKTWALIPFNPDWRWGLTGEKTIWYPSVKMFRQPRKGDWASVFSQIEKEIKNEPKFN
jgi:tetratricopeptide (TPR) repeat protein